MAEKLEIDDKAWRLLGALQADGRAPLKVLADAAGLSIPATAERLRRLQDAGVLRALGAELDPARVGYGVQAQVGITVVGQAAKRAFLAAAERAPEVLSCQHVAGADSYLMQVVATDLAHLEQFLGAINRHGETRTAIVLSTPIARRALVPPGQARPTARRDLGQSGPP